MRKAYKEILENVLVNVFEDKLETAVDFAWGTFHGKAIRYRTKKAIEKYLELVRQEVFGE